MMHKFWRSAALSLFGGIGLLSLTFACYRLHLNLATVGFLFVIVIALLSLMGDFLSSIIAGITAVICLAYLAPPANSFWVNDPRDVVAVIAFLTTSVIIVRLVSKLRKMADDALSSVSHKVIEAEEQERKRLAVELHEDIGQRLSLLATEIGSIKKDLPNQNIEGRSRMDTACKQVLKILTDVKGLAHELHSPRLGCLSLAEVMKSFCAEFAERKKVQIKFTSHGLPDLVPLDISLCLFRVLQEALHNATKHSGVAQFNVKLQGTLNEVQLKVSESGVSFDLEAARDGRGLGINRMRERVKLVKGILSIDSHTKGGTTILACVPLSSGNDSMRAAA